MVYNQIEKLASAIRNDVVSGLRGLHQDMSMSIEQLMDDIVDERLLILKEYSLKGIIPVKDLYISVNCVPVDCKDLERCGPCCDNDCPTPTAHFEIPLILNDYGALSIDYIGSTDRLNPFVWYTSSTAFRQHKYRKRGKNKPYVWIDTTPNANGMYDGFIFGAPLISLISVTAIFKDLRQLFNLLCCQQYVDDNMSFINAEIKKRVTEKKIRYYRQLAAPLLPNDQTYNQG